MAHFAKIENNKVKQVLVIGDADCGGGTFPASESVGQTFIASLNLSGEWKQTSYNGNFRGRYAGLGFTYDADLDGFVAPPTPELPSV